MAVVGGLLYRPLQNPLSISEIPEMRGKSEQPSPKQSAFQKKDRTDGHACCEHRNVTFEVNAQPQPDLGDDEVAFKVPVSPNHTRTELCDSPSAVPSKSPPRPRFPGTLNGTSGRRKSLPLCGQLA